MEDRKTIPPIAPADLRAGCRVVAMSDVGCVREENQDFMGYFRRGESQLLIVADGMGGHSGGFEASRVAVDVLGSAFAEAPPEQSPESLLRESILAANAAVRNVASSNPLLEGMGTTIVVAIVQDGKAYLAHVGDSRAYLIRDNKAILLTLDHSRIFRMLEAGMVHAGQIDDHPMGHILERSIGSNAVVEVEVRTEPVTLQAGDRLVLCSDGLWGMVKDPEIAALFHKENLAEAVEHSIGMALARGADDNTTVGALEVVDGPDSAPAVADCRAALLAANPVPTPEPEASEAEAPEARVRARPPVFVAKKSQLRRNGAIIVGILLLVLAFLTYKKFTSTEEALISSEEAKAKAEKERDEAEEAGKKIKEENEKLKDDADAKTKADAKEAEEVQEAKKAEKAKARKSRKRADAKTKAAKAAKDAKTAKATKDAKDAKDAKVKVKAAEDAKAAKVKVKAAEQALPSSALVPVPAPAPVPVPGPVPVPVPAPEPAPAPAPKPEPEPEPEPKPEPGAN
jgi:serine/threonine protein phosphatase PrpC